MSWPLFLVWELIATGFHNDTNLSRNTQCKQITIGHQKSHALPDYWCELVRLLLGWKVRIIFHIFFGSFFYWVKDFQHNTFQDYFWSPNSSLCFSLKLKILGDFLHLWAWNFPPIYSTRVLCSYSWCFIDPYIYLPPWKVVIDDTEQYEIEVGYSIIYRLGGVDTWPVTAYQSGCKVILWGCTNIQLFPWENSPHFFLNRNRRAWSFRPMSSIPWWAN